MGAQRPAISDDGENRVLKFRPRDASARAGGSSPIDPSVLEATKPGEAARDLSRYEAAHPTADDFRHRMLANAAAIAFTLALLAVGIWLAKSIAQLRNTQDCLLMGRRDCAPISTTTD